MSKYDLRLPRTEHGAISSCLSNPPVPVKPSPKPVATHTILDHMAPCWHCNKRLQACHPNGKPNLSQYGTSPNYKGCALAYVAEIDGYERRLHRACAEELGFRILLS